MYFFWTMPDRYVEVEVDICRRSGVFLDTEVCG